MNLIRSFITELSIAHFEKLTGSGLPSDLSSSFNTLISLAKGVCSVIGIIMTIWGIISFATAISAQDGNQRTHGIMQIIAGLIIAVAPQLLTLFGIGTTV